MQNATQPTEIALIYTVFPSTEEADALARALVSEGLAGCANRLAPCRSHYLWDGALESAEEHPVLFKTTIDRQSALMDALQTRHSYAVPAILTFTGVHASAAYARWLAGSPDPSL